MLAGLCIYNVLQAVMVFRENDARYSQQLISQIGIQLTEQAVSVYMPGLLYAEKEYEGGEILEDESTCETILEMNGRTLAERLLGENQSDAVIRKTKRLSRKSRKYRKVKPGKRRLQRR